MTAYIYTIYQVRGTFYQVQDKYTFPGGEKLTAGKTVGNGILVFSYAGSKYAIGTRSPH